MNKLKDNKNLFQFIKFGLVGCSNTLISLIIYYVLLYFNVNYILAYIVGFIVSVLNAYYWNNKYVFKNSISNQKKKMLKTFLAYGITFILSNLLLFIQVNYLNISKVVAPVICLFVTIPLNFIINKFWTFKEKESNY